MGPLLSSFVLWVSLQVRRFPSFGYIGIVLVRISRHVCVGGFFTKVIGSLSTCVGEGISILWLC